VEAHATRREDSEIQAESFPAGKEAEFLHATAPVPEKLKTISAPLWSFRVTPHQQMRLQRMSEALEGRAHVAYASPAFHTYTDLFRHTQRRTMVQNSSFPSVETLKGHEAWYYQTPGAKGAANPDPESIEEPSLLERIVGLARATDAFEGGDLKWLDLTARGVIDAASGTHQVAVDGRTAHFFDDLQTLERLTERFEIQESLRAYAQVALFTIRFDLNWLVVADG
jgi:hypothetical protein